MARGHLRHKGTLECIACERHESGELRGTFRMQLVRCRTFDGRDAEPGGELLDVVNALTVSQVQHPRIRVHRRAELLFFFEAVSRQDDFLALSWNRSLQSIAEN